MSQKQPRDPLGRHIRVYVTLMETPAHRVLSYSAQALFTRLRMFLTANNNGNISATLSTLKQYGWTSSATLASALGELQTLGFIAQTRGGGVRHGSRVCSLYRFTDIDCYEVSKLNIPYLRADHLYRQFSTVAEARNALTAEKEKKSTLQKLKHTASEIEALSGSNASEIEVEGSPLLQKLKQTEEGEISPPALTPQGIDPLESSEGECTRSTSISEHLYTLPSQCAEKVPSEGVERGGKHRAPTAKRSEVEEWL